MTEQKTENASGATENQTGSQPTESNETTKTSPENNQSGNQTIKQTGSEIIGQVKEKANGLLDEQKTNLTFGLTSVAGSLRQVGDNLRTAGEQNAVGKFTAQYGDEIARRIEDISGYIENADLKDIARDVETLARRQPALFIGGAFALGLLTARFLKSSRSDQNSANRGRGSRAAGESSSNRQTASKNA